MAQPGEQLYQLLGIQVSLLADPSAVVSPAGHAAEVALPALS